MKILFLGYTSKKYNGHSTIIDRPDLTRKMSCLETWVPRVEKLGHEVIFFDGSNEVQSFDKNNRILHLVADERYDDSRLEFEKKPSYMIERLREAINWALGNREFDYIFRTDDGSYINAYVLEDVIKLLQEKELDILTSTELCARGGIFMSRKFCESFVKNFVNIHNFHIEDRALRVFFNTPEYGFKVATSHLLYQQYVVGEKLFTMHYTNGKRQYFVDDIISYYYTGTSIKRKVVLGLPLQKVLPEEKLTLPVKTWDTGEKTTLWYSFDKDDKNWEYYGGYARSDYCPVAVPCVFGENSLEELVICDTVYNLDDSHQVNTFMKYVDAVTDYGTLYIHFSTTDVSSYKKYNGQHSIQTLEEYISKLKEYVDIVSITDNVTDSGIEAEFMQYATGTFIKMKKKGV